MITRPLDLASKLRPQPRSYDWLFYVNGILIVVFFSVFGSRFVLAPGLGVEFRLPEFAGATANARPTTHFITVVHSGLILTSDGNRKLEELRGWLREQAGATPAPALLVRGGEDVPLHVLVEISSAAREAGFTVLFAGDEPPAGAGARGR